MTLEEVAHHAPSRPDPRTGEPDPTKMGAFLQKHPETVAFAARMKASRSGN
jgi:hypothetical protein